MIKTITLKRTFAYPPEMLWNALTDSDQLADWLMPNDFRPEVGHEFQFQTKPAPGFDGIVNCKVLEITPMKLLKISWQGGGVDTTVSFLLTATGNGTELELRHDGFRLPNIIARLVLGSGWKKLLDDKLTSTLTRQHTGER